MSANLNPEPKPVACEADDGNPARFLFTLKDSDSASNYSFLCLSCAQTALADTDLAEEGGFVIETL